MRKIVVPAVAILAVFSLLMAIFAGYNRLGWYELQTGMGGEHGALMVGSFLGTLILLERVITIRNKLFLAFPFINAVSLPLFFFEMPTYGIICLTIGSIALAYVYLDILSKSKEIGFYVMLCGAACWTFGNVLVLQYRLYPMALPWWICFLLLTIVGERLELTKFLPVIKIQKCILTSLLTITTIALGLFFHKDGQVIAGFAIIGIVAWLIKYDMIRKSLKKKGLHRYSAALLGTGYIWLAIFGVILVLGSYADMSYDSMVHTFFIGFVINMIFAHAPIILPGVAKLGFYPYHPTLYISGVFLQLSLLARIIGNLLNLYDLKFYGAVFSGIFIISFFLNIVIIVLVKKMKIESGGKTNDPLYFGFVKDQIKAKA